MNTDEFDRALKAGRAAQNAVDEILKAQAEPRVVIELSPDIWANVTAKFPWARTDPDMAVTFLLGLALGVWMDRNKEPS